METSYDLMWLTLLNSDVNDIANLCSTNKISNVICDDPDFWYAKFNYDQLPIITPITYNNVNIKQIAQYYKKVFYSCPWIIIKYFNY